MAPVSLSTAARGRHPTELCAAVTCCHTEGNAEPLPRLPGLAHFLSVPTCHTPAPTQPAHGDPSLPCFVLWLLHSTEHNSTT